VAAATVVAGVVAVAAAAAMTSNTTAATPELPRPSRMATRRATAAVVAAAVEAMAHQTVVAIRVAVTMTGVVVEVATMMTVAGGATMTTAVAAAAAVVAVVAAAAAAGTAGDVRDARVTPACGSIACPVRGDKTMCLDSCDSHILCLSLPLTGGGGRHSSHPPRQRDVLPDDVTQLTELKKHEKVCMQAQHINCCTPCMQHAQHMTHTDDPPPLLPPPFCSK
jgi:hypothetical protein